MADDMTFKVGLADAPLLLSILETARRLGVSRSRTYELAAAGRLDVRKLDGRSLVTLASIEALVASLPPANIGQQRKRGADRRDVPA